MTELAVKIMGEPNLIQPSQPVALLDQSIEVIVKDLKDTMKKEGGVGIAAPQAGVSQRIRDRYSEVKPVLLVRNVSKNVNTFKGLCLITHVSITMPSLTVY